MSSKSGKWAGIAALSCVIGSVGCSAATGDESKPGEEVSTESAKLVHRVDAGKGHIVEFYDLGDGQVGVMEEYAMDDKSLLDHDAALEGLSLADTYKRMRLGDAVPDAVLAADAHAEATLAAPQVIREVPSTPVAAPPEVGKVEQAAVNCSADLLGDGWGGQWFIDNFGSLWNYTCGGEFVNVASHKNMGGIHFSAGGKYVWLWKGFEGDFNVAGSYKIYRNGFGLPANQPLGSGSIPPRKVVEWTIRGGWNNQTNHVESKSPCGHAGGAQVWCGLL